VFFYHVQAAFSIPSRTSTSTHTVPSVLPAPTPQLPPAFFSSTITQLNSLDSFSSGGRSASAAKLDILDDLSGTGGGTDGSILAQTSMPLDALDGLDSLDTLDAVLDAMPTAVATEKVNEPTTELDVGEKSLDELLDVSDPIGQNGGVPKISIKATEKLDCLDALDSFPAEEGVDVALPAVSIWGRGLDSLSDFSSNGDYQTLVTYD